MSPYFDDVINPEVRVTRFMTAYCIVTFATAQSENLHSFKVFLKSK